MIHWKASNNLTDLSFKLTALMQGFAWDEVIDCPIFQLYSLSAVKKLDVLGINFA